MKFIVVLFVTGFSWAGFSQQLLSSTEKIVGKSAMPQSTTDTISANDQSYLAYTDTANLKTLSGRSVTKFLADNYNYPNEAFDNEISGTIYIHFIVEKDGTVSNVTIEKGLCKACDAEVIRVVKRLRVHPVMIDGKAERIRFRVPIRLVLE